MDGGYLVGAEHGRAPSGLSAHTLQQGLLPQVAEQPLKDVALQLTKGWHQHLHNRNKAAVASILNTMNSNEVKYTISSIVMMAVHLHHHITCMNENNSNRKNKNIKVLFQ